MGRNEFDEAGVPLTGRPDRLDDPMAAGLSLIGSSIGEIGPKLDRIEDALHDIAQVLARTVGPPWDEAEG
jgi:hypothetical protein